MNWEIENLLEEILGFLGIFVVKSNRTFNDVKLCGTKIRIYTSSIENLKCKFRVFCYDGIKPECTVRNGPTWYHDSVFG